MKTAYAEVELPLVDPPGRDRLEADARSADVHIRQRAQAYLKRLDAGEPLPRAVPLPVSILRFGDDLTFVVMGGEVVVDYARRFKRLLANDNPWPVGYAYGVLHPRRPSHQGGRIRERLLDDLLRLLRPVPNERRRQSGRARHRHGD